MTFRLYFFVRELKKKLFKIKKLISRYQNTFSFTRELSLRVKKAFMTLELKDKLYKINIYLISAVIIY